MVVEDHADSLELFVVILEQLGATVLPATTAQQAFELLTLHHPDVLVSDIGLPDEDGHMLVKRIRGLPSGQGGTIPAIAVTAHATFRDRRDALTAGFDSYLAKPVDMVRLCDAIVELVHGPSSSVR